MFRTKYIFAIGLMIFFINLQANLIAKLPPDLGSLSVNKPNTSIAYSIVVPGRANSNGRISPSTVYHIERLAPDKYLPNTIHVKTRNFVPLADNKFKKPVLQKETDLLGIVNIRAPFADFHSGNLQSADVYGISRILEITYSAALDPYEACIEMMKNPDVEYAVPIFNRYPTDFTPNDSLIGNQWLVNNIQLKKAWDLTKGDKNVVIAIVDNGVDWQHRDLAVNIWTNPGEIAGDGIDNDNNGKIDDIRGWDFVGNVSSQEAYSGAWKEDNNPKPSSNNVFHGTHVAGCASAVTNNVTGIAGPGFNCSILPVKCGSDDPNLINVFRGYEGIMYAAKLGAKVINCSWSGPGSSPAEEEIINTAMDLGAVVVVAAGNDGENVDDGNNYPAGYKNVLCVGATSSNNRRASFSNYGRLVTVYSPGQSIYSTMPNNAYANQNGTSMASPVTAGVVGLVWSVHPNWTPQQVIRQIRSTSDNVVTTNQSQRPLYYGRINAYKAIDYNITSSYINKVPGLFITDFSFNTGEALTDYKPQKIQFNMINYLAKAKGLKVKITPLNNYYSVSQNEFTIGDVSLMETKNFELTVQLLNTNPWFFGNADMLITYEAEDYLDYQIIQLPIRISSNNSYVRTYIFPETQYPTWYSAKAPARNIAWLVGYEAASRYGFFLKYYNSMSIGAIAANEAIYSLYAFDGNTVFAGSGPTSGDAKIFKTVNGGASWSSQSVRTITNFVNDIHFFDNNEGIFLGDQLNGNWGIGATVNGGTAWTKVNGVPQPIDTTESGLVGATFCKGDTVIFGTNQGRIISTKDRGKTWEVNTVFQGGIIKKIAFSNEFNGIALYSETSAQNAPVKVARTISSGVSWTTNVYDFGAKGLTPVYLFSPAGSAQIITICSNGQVFSTEDVGETWTPILSQKGGTIIIGAAYSEGQDARLWGAWKEVFYLDFEYLPENPNRVLTIESGSSINFDSVEVDKMVTDVVKLKNTGNMKIHIDSIVVRPLDGVKDEEFQVSQNLPTILSINKTTNILVRFNPKEVGLRQANLMITTDAEPNVVNVLLTGYGKEPVSVIDNNLPNELIFEQSYPNPCTDLTYARFTLKELQQIKLELYNSMGDKIKEVYSGAAEVGLNIIPISTIEYPSGAYYLKLQAGERIVIRKLLIVK